MLTVMVNLVIILKLQKGTCYTSSKAHGFVSVLCNSMWDSCQPQYFCPIALDWAEELSAAYHVIARIGAILQELSVSYNTHNDNLQWTIPMDDDKL